MGKVETMKKVGFKVFCRGCNRTFDAVGYYLDYYVEASQESDDFAESLHPRIDCDEE